MLRISFGPRTFAKIGRIERVSWVGKMRFRFISLDISSGVCSSKALIAGSITAPEPPTLLMRMLRCRSLTTLMTFSTSVAQSGEEASATAMRNEVLG